MATAPSEDASVAASPTRARSVPAKVRAAWTRLSPLPGGKRLFSAFVGQSAPYTGTIGAVVQELGPGTATVTLRDRRRVRNHLRCVHAVALVNLAEVTTGLAMMMNMPDDARGILAGLSIEYHKKARGLLTATCTAPQVPDSTRREFQVRGEIHDTSGDLVASATARWLVGPVRAST